MRLSRREGRAHTKLPPAETLADGVEGGVGATNFELAKELVDDVVCVGEGAIASAMREVLLREKLLVEGAGALGVAALLGGEVEGSRIAVVLSGGNVDLAVLRSVLQEAPPRRS
jgi:threonine dehydratase